jgi:hypothetical protein
MKKGIIMRLHKEGHGSIMALSDEGLLGKNFLEGEISFKVTEGFYGGDIVDKNVILRTIHTVASINAIGEESVSLLIDAGYGDRDAVRMIDGIPHIQVYMML